MRRTTIVAVSAVTIGLALGSTFGVTAQGDGDPPPSVAACDEPLVEPGVYDAVNDVDDVSQAYRVVVPGSYADIAPAPLILWLAAENGELEPAYEWWRPYLDPARSIFVTAELQDFDHTRPSTLTALIDQLVAAYCVDPRRIHAMGQSSSGPVVAELACDVPHRIASIYAGMGSFRPLMCASPRPVPLIAVTGDPNRTVSSRAVAWWAERNGCDPEPLREHLGSGVTRSTYQGCEADTVFYDVDGAGHGFIRDGCVGTGGDYCIENEVFDLLREVERFFAEHPLPV